MQRNLSCSHGWFFAEGDVMKPTHSTQLSRDEQLIGRGQPHQNGHFNLKIAFMDQQIYKEGLVKLNLRDSVAARKAKISKLNLVKVSTSKNALAVEKIDPGNCDDLLN